MLDFKRLEFEDFAKIKKYFDEDNRRFISDNIDIICDRVFDCTFFWRNYYSTKYALHENSVIISICVGNTEMFSFPIGGDVYAALKEIKSHTKNTGACFCFIPESDLHFFREIFDYVYISEETDWSDYVYNINDLTTYSGRRLHGQRNLYNRFLKTNPHAKLIPMTAENAASVVPFIEKWFADHNDFSSMSLYEEKGIYELLNYSNIYSMKGGILTTNGNIIGFTAGDIVGNTAFIQIEKADHSIPGAYQYMSAEYLKLIDNGNIKSVNREEDMGIPGLRRAKEALHPIYKLKKYTLFCH